MEKAIWLNYDLGVGGDYQGLYAWLDDLKAIECGSNTAFFKYPISSTVTSNTQLKDELTKTLNERVQYKPTNRVYVAFKSLEKDKMVGSFIWGNRKASPWTGYGAKVESAVLDE